MTSDFDLESLVHVEQTFYDSGYQDGFAHGRIHGLIEGRALGREQGFAMWEELGFYEGFALTWRAILVKQSREDDRASQHIRHLLDSISHFPRVNPTPSSSEEEVDVQKLFRQIRSRYKILCSSLGVRPRVHSSDVGVGVGGNEDGDQKKSTGTGDGNPDADDDAMQVHTIDKGRDSTVSTSTQRVNPGSAIPVWKIDNAGVKKPVTNQDLNF